MSDPLVVLAVSADETYLDEFRAWFSGDGRFAVRTAGSVDGAVSVLAGDPVDCVVSDYDLPDATGVRLLQVVRAQASTLPFVLFTQHGTEEAASDAIAADVTDYLIKERFDDQWDRLATLLAVAAEGRRDREGLLDPDSRTEAVLNAVPDGVLVARDGRVLFGNDSAARLLGAVDPDALVGDPVEQRVRPRERAPLDRVVDSITAGETAFGRVELDLFRPNRGYVPAEVSVARAGWRSESALVYVLTDVSDRRAVEQELAVKSRAMDDAPVGITLADARRPDTPLVYVNERFTELTGYSEAAALGRNCRFLQGEDTDEQSVRAVREAIDAEEPVTVELLNYRRDGTEFWNRLTIAPLREGGDVTHYVGFQEDVTEQVAAQRDLRRFKKAVEAAGQAIFTADPDGTITYVNPAFEEMTGYEPSELIGETPAHLRSSHPDAEHYERLWEAVLSGESRSEEIVDRRASGGTYHAIQTVSPITDADGDVEEFVAIQTDITARREHERHLATLDRVFRHDLRNRLNVLMGHAEAIRTAPDGEAVDERVETVLSVADDLLSLADRGREINELVLERPRPVPLEIVSVLEDAIDPVREAHPEAEIAFTASVPTETSVVATESVADAVATLVEYLLDHADADDPSVDVAVERTADGALRIGVADEDDPIPEIEQDVVMDTADIDALNHGTGLDLWFVYWAVHRSNGTLSFEDAGEAGNRIRIELHGRAD